VHALDECPHGQALFGRGQRLPAVVDNRRQPPALFFPVKGSFRRRLLKVYFGTRPRGLGLNLLKHAAETALILSQRPDLLDDEALDLLGGKGLGSGR
jgi:hypothetical protein